MSDHVQKLNNNVFGFRIFGVFLVLPAYKALGDIFLLRNSEIKVTRHFSEEGNIYSAISKHFLSHSFIAITVHT